MTRDELLNALENDMKYVQRYRKKKEEFNQHDSTETRMKLDWRNSKKKWLLLIVLPAAFLIFNMINPFTDSNKFEDIAAGVIVAFIVSFILKKKEERKHKGELSILKSEMEHLKDAYYKNATLPETCQGIRKTERFHYYVTNFIADNLKDCALLYHQEVQNEKLVKSMEYISESVWESNSMLADELGQVNESLGAIDRGVASVKNEANSIKWNTKSM